MSCGWFYNDVSGEVRYDCGASYLADLLAVKIGTWHGPYATEQDAESHPGVTGAKATPNENPASAAGNAAANAASSSLTGLFTNTSLLTRVAEIVIGGGLILIGLAALLRKPAETVASTAAKVAK
jgi:hypothetical protein